ERGPAGRDRTSIEVGDYRLRAVEVAQLEQRLGMVGARARRLARPDPRPELGVALEMAGRGGGVPDRELDEAKGRQRVRRAPLVTGRVRVGLQRLRLRPRLADTALLRMDEGKVVERLAPLVRLGRLL